VSRKELKATNAALLTLHGAARILEKARVAFDARALSRIRIVRANAAQVARAAADGAKATGLARKARFQRRRVGKEAKVAVTARELTRVLNCLADGARLTRRLARFELEAAGHAKRAKLGRGDADGGACFAWHAPALAFAQCKRANLAR
jgi:hypothetical protein